MSNAGLFNHKEWILLVLLFISIGCSMNRLPNIEAINQASLVQSRQSSQSPQEAVSLAEKDIETAHREALEYFAPIHLSLAEQSLKKAQSLLLKGADSIAVIAETIKSRKMTADGLLTKQSVIRQLRDVFELKERLQELKAELYFRDEYEDQLDNIKDLIRYIEKGDQETLDDKKKDCFGEMLALEIDVVKKITLSEPIQVFKMAKKIDAKDLAPKTWKIAEDTLKQSQVCIESFHRDKARVAKAGNDALRACQHVYFVTKEVLSIQDIDEDEFENLVLDIENKLNRISLGLNHGDVRYMSLYDQSVALSGVAEGLNSKLSKYFPKETHSKVQEEIVAGTKGSSMDKGTTEEVFDVIADGVPDVEKSSGNDQAIVIVSEESEQETEVAETLSNEPISDKQDSRFMETDESVVNKVETVENDQAIVIASEESEQETEVAEILSNEPISDKQDSRIMEADESAVNKVETVENDQAIVIVSEEPAPETKDLEAVNEVAPGIAEDIIPSAKQESGVSDTSDRVEPN